VILIIEALPRLVERNCLVHLLQQAVAYLLEFHAALYSGVTHRVNTLLHGFQAIAMPRQLAGTFCGHSHSV
jgi:hypothetical protein